MSRLQLPQQPVRVVDAARFLNVKAADLSAEIGRGEFPVVKVGDAILVHLPTAVEWLTNKARINAGLQAKPAPPVPGSCDTRSSIGVIMPQPETFMAVDPWQGTTLQISVGPSQSGGRLLDITIDYDLEPQSLQQMTLHIPTANAHLLERAMLEAFVGAMEMPENKHLKISILPGS